jgi:hypothetical protein
MLAIYFCILIIGCVFAYVMNKGIPQIDTGRILNIMLIIALVLWILSVTGIVGSYPIIHVGR